MGRRILQQRAKHAARTAHRVAKRAGALRHKQQGRHGGGSARGGRKGARRR